MNIQDAVELAHFTMVNVVLCELHLDFKKKRTVRREIVSHTRYHDKLQVDQRLTCRK